MHQTDVMIDIETLSTQKNAVILTIGIAEFTLDDPEIEVANKKHFVINPSTAQRAGLHLDAATIVWWMGQSDTARASLSSKSSISLTNALHQLSEYIQAVRARNNKNRLNVWGNDPDFDMVILGEAYAAIGEQQPWQFWETRSCRTMKELGDRILGFNEKIDLPRVGTHHAADDDAVHQALVVKAIYEKLANNVKA